MNLFELIRTPATLNEGGNVSSQSPGWQGEPDQEAEEIDLKIHDRDYMVDQLRSLLQAQNESFKAAYGRYIWEPKLLASGQMFSGSSLTFFDIKGVSTQDFLNKLKKTKVGDIDTQVDQEIGDEITAWLKSIIGKQVGNGKFIGFNSSLSSIWLLNDPPVRVQVDYELGPYDPETNAPSEWFAYSHSSAYDDMAAGIKGVFHKYINRAMTGALKTSEKYVARVLKKSVKISDTPVVDSDYSFAVSSAQGGGMSKKYKPYIDPATGEPMMKDGIPVMQLLDTKDRDYIQNLDQQFQILFGRKRSETDKKLQNSFVGTIQLLNKSFTPEQNESVARSFLDILFGPGAQMITKNDPERDREIKFSAVDAMLLGGNGIKPLNVPNSNDLRQEAVRMAMDYADKFKAKQAGKVSTDTEVAEDAEASAAAKPNYARQGIKHIYNRLPDGRVSSAEMKDAEFIDLCKEIAENNGTLNDIIINLKVDGAGIRFGRDSAGRPFFMTSKVTTPLYIDDVGYFTRFGQEKGQEGEQLARTKNYDKALELITGSNFIQTLPKDTIVQAEMLYNPMAEKTPEGLKFVNIPYDPKKLGKQMTLVPFMFKTFSTGEDRPDADKIKKKLLAASNSNVKIISNQLEQKGINVSKIIEPVLGLNPANKKSNKEILDFARQQLSDAIINSPKLKGIDTLGENQEGIVINMPSGKLVKVTSPKMKAAMAAKLANKAPAAPRSGLDKTAVVAVGSFVGHRGHEDLWERTINKAKEVGGDPYLFIGNAVGKDDPIPTSVKVETWHRMYPEYADNISTVTHQGGTLLQKLKHELINPTPGQPPKYDNIIIMVGEDQKDLPFANALMKAVNKFPGYEHVKAKLEVTPRSTGIKFTDLRNILSNSNATPEQQYAVWAQGFDEQKLGKDWILHLMNIARRGMGLQQKPQSELHPVAEQKLFTALIRPSNVIQENQISEGPELKSTLQAIRNDIGEPVLQLYSTLRQMAKQYVDNHGELKGFQMVAAGAAKRWYDTFYFNRLGKELRHLTQQSTRHAAPLNDFLSTLPKNFSAVANDLPEILVQFGQKIGDKELARLSQVWINTRENFKKYLDDLEASTDDDFDEPVEKTPKNKTLGQQASQAEEIVNSILKKLPSRISGDIRNAIARAPNKLQALQAELQKRNVKVPMGETMLPKSAFVGISHNKLGPAAHLTGKMKRSAQQGDLVGEMDEDWQKINKSDKTDGLSKKAVKAYRRENPGSKLKTAVTKKPSKIKKGSSDDKRRKSFCARMSGMKKAHASAKTKRNPDSPINKALRRWNCESIQELHSVLESLKKQVTAEEKKKGADGKACWKGYRYAGTEKGKDKCVPVSESVENIMSILIDRIVANEAIQDHKR